MPLDFEIYQPRHASDARAAVPLPGDVAALPVHLLKHVLDHIDYGIACVDGAGRLLYANRAARESWTKVHLDREPLRGAIYAASTRGTRRLVEASAADWRFTIAVIPLADVAGGSNQVLLVLGKHSVCERLSSYWYGVARGLTAAEQAVLEEIAAGCSPRDIAARRSVSLATVRSHITSLRGKTGTNNLYALLREMAQLPPIRCAPTEFAAPGAASPAS
jgi:DNA-binding CsgD family transcriptional regulator